MGEIIILNNDMKKNVTEIDITPLTYSEQIIAVKRAMSKIKINTILKIRASAPNFYYDVVSWCKVTHNKLVSINTIDHAAEVEIEKTSNNVELNKENSIKQKTLLIFSDDLDRAAAAFIIANGAIATGNRVTMFFMFWGINIIRKGEKIQKRRTTTDIVTDRFMPRDSRHLKLSRMKVLGIGSRNMRRLMKDRNIGSLEKLIVTAIKGGVNMIACGMSMELLNIKKEELIDGVTIGGVEDFIESGDISQFSLFI
ncbi:DsrE/DsrF/DrsH-like family protein [Clostridium oryzae]|uniref:UPF0033 domain-containing protein n=1 Tax=Clostridium oryzae TaxID=1450648 RepID=A0A1V4IR57_9CLOT|nr:DsrE/DsrF/DrsH-like family protein [Clostridium oryzae]OPJ62393.1 hypothetical protein CLORY_17620 [Clostridium oryzae]